MFYMHRDHGHFKKVVWFYEIVGHFVFLKLFLVSWILNEIACMSQCNKQNLLSNLFDFVALVLFIHLLCLNL